MLVWGQFGVSYLLPYFVMGSDGVMIDWYQAWVDVVSGDQTEITVHSQTRRTSYTEPSPHLPIRGSRTGRVLIIA
jgi:hypothetical protein